MISQHVPRYIFIWILHFLKLEWVLEQSYSKGVVQLKITGQYVIRKVKKN